MAVTLKQVLDHLIRHGEGYHTPAIRQQHLDAVAAMPGDPAELANPSEPAPAGSTEEKES